MEKRIELERRGRHPSEIKDLNLDNCHTTSIVGLTDEYCNMKSLSLINVGLTSLKGFPKLPSLERLELSDNRITGGLNLLHTSPKLTHLNLSGNKIRDLEAIVPLREFKNLTVLDLFNCDVTSIEDYRSKVFSLIPSLKCLDGYDSEEKEAEESEDEEVEEDDEEDDDEVDDEDSGNIASLANDNIDEESEGGDFDPGEYGDHLGESDDDEEDDEEEEDINTALRSGVKRKSMNDDENDDDEEDDINDDDDDEEDLKANANDISNDSTGNRKKRRLDEEEGQGDSNTNGGE